MLRGVYTVQTLPSRQDFFVMHFRNGNLMGARNRVGIGLSYRPTRLFRLAESIPWNWFLGLWKFQKSVSELNTVFHLFTTACTQCPILTNPQCKTGPYTVKRLLIFPAGMSLNQTLPGGTGKSWTFFYSVIYVISTVAFLKMRIFVWSKPGSAVMTNNLVEYF